MKKFIPVLLFTLLAFSNLVDAAFHANNSSKSDEMSPQCECVEDNCDDCNNPEDNHAEKKCDHCNHIHTCSIYVMNNSVPLKQDIPAKNISLFSHTENFSLKNYSNLLYRPPII